jgi:signal transduction histidine kinase
VIDRSVPNRAGGATTGESFGEGQGFVPARAGESGGVGLVNMRERVRPLDGRLEIESQPGRGTTIHAEVPVRA